jgi:hypothetical protein
MWIPTWSNVVSITNRFVSALPTNHILLMLLGYLAELSVPFIALKPVQND